MSWTSGFAARPRRWRRLSAGELLAVMDLRQARAGARLFHLDATDVRAPFSIEILQVQPTSVALAFEPTETKIVMVTPRIEGEPAPGFDRRRRSRASRRR